MNAYERTTRMYVNIDGIFSKNKHSFKFTYFVTCIIIIATIIIRKLLIQTILSQERIEASL